MTAPTVLPTLAPGDTLLLEPGCERSLPAPPPPGVAVCAAPATAPREWDGLVRARQVTVVCLWPSTLARWLADGQALPESIRLIVCGGEALPRSVAQACAAASRAALVHTAGPEEALNAGAHAQLGWVVDLASCLGERVPVGRPLASAGIRLLDAAGRPAPAGTVGRLHWPVADGAWQPGADLARQGRDGLVDIVGSQDGMLRLRGRRVDPAAVRHALLGLPTLADAHVALRLRADRGAVLVAWVVLRPSREQPDAAALISALPEALRPDTVVPVSCLPLTRAGGVDDTALDQLGLPDTESADQWQRQLMRTPGVSEAVVRVQPRSRPAGAPWPPMPDAAAGQGESPASTPEASIPASAAGAATDASTETSTGSAPLESAGPPLAPLRWATLGDALRACAEAAPTHGVRFLDADTDHFLPYPALLEQALRVLSGLRADGARAGDAVILLVSDQQGFLCGFWACVLGGLVPVPMAAPPVWDPAHAAAQKLVNVWTLLQQPRVLAGAAQADVLPALGIAFTVSVLERCAQHAPATQPHPAAPDDLALMLLTSGSTGTPKAVMHSHRTVLSRCEMARALRGFTRDTVSLNWLPLDHVGAIVMFHVRDVTLHCQQLHAPTDLVIAQPLRWLDWAHRWRVTVTWAPNFAFGLVNARAAEIAQRQWDLSALSVIVNAGEAIVPATARRFLTLLAPHGLPASAMCPEWGMSETSSAVVASSRFAVATTQDSDAFADLGPPMAGTRLRIVDAQPGRAGTPPIGRLQVRGPSVTLGYYRNDAAMRESFTADGWFDTGDLGFLREGRLTLTGRAKDCVIVNGINLYSHEVEAIVETVPGVAVSYTAVCAHRPEGANTDEMVVFFVPQDATAAATLAGRIRAEVARRLGVSARHLVALHADEVPKTAIGKIQRAQLQQRFRAGDFAQRLLAPADAAPAAGDANTLPDCLASVRWLRCDPDGAPRPQGHWLLLGGGADTRARFAQALQQAGATVAMHPADAASLAMPTEPPPAEADHLLWLDLVDTPVATGATGATDAIDAADSEAQAALARAAVLLNWLLGRPGPQRPLHWVVPTRGLGAGATPDPQPPNLAHAPLVAWLASVSAEHPWLHTHLVDLEPAAARAEPPALLAAALAATDEPLSAWRRGKRWVRRLQPVTPATEAVRPWRFERGACWVLAGGLGGIGQHVARALAAQGVALLIVGRRDATAAPVAQALAALRADGGSGGTVDYRACDVADAARLREAVAPWLGARPLAGVVQASADGSLAAQWNDPQAAPSDARINQQHRAKMAGSLALAALLAPHPDAAFVGFSSVTATLGAATLAGYAAGNAFLSVLCAALHRQGRRACAIEWSMWADTGMAAGAPAMLGERTQAQGYHLLSPAQGLQALQQAARLGLPQLLVGVAAHHPAWRFRGAQPSEALAALTAFVVAPDAPPLPAPAALHHHSVLLPALPRGADGALDLAALAARSDGTPAAGPAAATPGTEWERRVHDLWCELLNLPRVGIHENFFEIGGHSMLLTQVRARLGEMAGRDVPMVDLFREPTIARLARYLAPAEGPADNAATPAASAGGGAPDGRIEDAASAAQRRQQALLEQQRRRAARAPASPN